MAPSVYAMAQKGDLITGKNQNTLGGPLLSQVTGLSLETANFVYSLPSLYTGSKPILGATARLGNQVVAEGSQMASAMGYVAGEVGKDVAAGYKAIPRPYKVAFGIEAGINTAAETIPYATGQREINGNNILQSGGKVIVDSTYSALTHKAGDGLGFGLDVTKGLAEGKSFGESIGDTTTSFAISKSADKVIKNENIKI